MEGTHVKKLSNGTGAKIQLYCYFTNNNCDDHTCTQGNQQGCNTLVTCETCNTGGSEYNGICKDKNYGQCIENIACSPKRNTIKSRGNDDSGLEKYILS